MLTGGNRSDDRNPINPCNGFQIEPPPMHRLVSAKEDSSRRFAVLAIVVAAQFMRQCLASS